MSLSELTAFEAGISMPFAIWDATLDPELKIVIMTNRHEENA
jgi:hypothetical protein